jgi:hypothetical protein
MSFLNLILPVARWGAAAVVVLTYLVAAGMAHVVALSFAARHRLIPGPTRASALLATAITDQIFNVVSLLLLAAILLMIAAACSRWAKGVRYSKVLWLCSICHVPMALWAMGAYWWTMRQLAGMYIPATVSSDPRPVAAGMLASFTQGLVGTRLAAYCLTLAAIAWCISRASDLGLGRSLAVAYGSGLCLFLLGRLMTLLA